MGAHLGVHNPAADLCPKVFPSVTQAQAQRTMGVGTGVEGSKSILIKKPNWRLRIDWCKHFSGL